MQRPCSGKASCWDWLGPRSKLEAAGTRELLEELGIVQGLCWSLGNNTQASGLMNSGSLHKSCWKVLSIRAGLEPLAASLLCLLEDTVQRWGGRSAHGWLSGEACYLPPGGEAKAGFAFPAWPGFDLDTCSLLLFFLGSSFCKEMQ